MPAPGKKSAANTSFLLKKRNGVEWTPLQPMKDRIYERICSHSANKDKKKRETMFFIANTVSRSLKVEIMTPKSVKKRVIGGFSRKSSSRTPKQTDQSDSEKFIENLWIFLEKF